ncbi:DRTGG domain-containing protein [Caloranaerobacter azorensis]|uniref:DRTGG domain-containing protein n=3 Tax=Caloranaerobacter azorensis TaxID=116090 RepID=A0A1M5UDP2_9FIRM|nr:DRTGG domain-containing protein [Caloranaerobacter azorensis]KGG81195.1 serine kinase [Caloranaerobacter azorensis H53214]QIB26607.1 serine kinase [Caloranaerobacter azorensis]SHH61154.1 DRTGG domain-containing protein [Caloranaerobacter azorensis DSM 13643]
MRLDKIVKELGLEVLTERDIEKEVKGVYIGDLLSLVMANASENNLWITIQTHLNIIAVATLVGLSAILIAEGMEVEDETIKKANEVKIPILRSKLSAYELACRLYELGV